VCVDPFLRQWSDDFGNTTIAILPPGLLRVPQTLTHSDPPLPLSPRGVIPLFPWNWPGPGAELQTAHTGTRGLPARRAWHIEHRGNQVALAGTGSGVGIDIGTAHSLPRPTR
jgi:hypothetical protein